MSLRNVDGIRKKQSFRMMRGPRLRRRRFSSRFTDVFSSQAWSWLAAALVLFSVMSAPDLAAAQSSTRELTALPEPSGMAYAAAPKLIDRGDGRYRMELELSEALAHDALVLTGPDRLVIDFPEIAWRLSAAEAEALRAPGVKGVRFGLFRVGRSRMVVDLEAPARILRRASAPAEDGRPAQFVLEFLLEPSAAALSEPAAPLRTTRTPAIARLSAELSRGPKSAPRPAVRPRPLIVALDPGHGGVDPGASYGGVSEKELTLAFAREAKIAIERAEGIRVVLTRTSDEYVPLRERVARARALGADLFLSIHADALPERPDVSGASIYTLSDQASDSLAAALAQRENAVDAIAGISMEDDGDDIRHILVDLAKQQTLVESDHMATLLIDELRRRVPVLKSRPHRYADFAVLRSFDAPAALIELGFLTNLRDRRRLTNPAWREQAAQSIADAVRRWALTDQRFAAVLR